MIIESETKDEKNINEEERLKYELGRVLAKYASFPLSINNLSLMVGEINSKKIIFNLKIDVKI